MAIKNLDEGLKVINSGQCPEGLTLNLADTNLEPADVTVLTEAVILTPGVNILGLDDDFPLVKRASQLAQHIALLWQVGGDDDESKGDVAYSQIVETIQETPQLLLILVSALTKRHALSGTQSEDYEGLIGALINELELTADLRNRLGPGGATAFAEALKSGRCPKGFTLNLGNNKLGLAGAIAFAEALKSGECPEGFTLKLWNNNLGLDGLTAFAEALKSGECPEGFTLDLGINNLGLAGATALAEALILTPGVNILGLDDDFPLVKRASQLAQHMALFWQAVDDGDNESIVDAFYSKIFETIQETPELLVILISQLIKTPLDETEHRAYAGLTNMLILELELTADLKDRITQITVNTVFEDVVKSRICSLEGGLKLINSGRCPEDLIISFFAVNDPGPGIIAVTKALTSGQCAPGLTLDLWSQSLGSPVAVAFTDAFRSGKCPEGLTLQLLSNHLGSAGAATFADAFRSGKCPKRLTLDLGDNNIGPDGAAALTEALILTPGVNILGLENDFPLVKRACQLAQHIALLWQAGDEESNDAAYSQIVETIQETPELLAILISQLIKTHALNDTERHAYAGLINALINQLELTDDLKDRITQIAVNSEFEDVVKNAAEMTSTRGQLPALLTDLNASVEMNEIEKQMREVLCGDFGLLTFLRDEIATFSEFSITLEGHISSITQANLGIEVMGFLGSLAALIASSDQGALQPYIPILHRLQFKVSTPDSLEKIEIEIPRVESCLRKLAFLTKTLGDLVKSPENTMGSSSGQQATSRNRHAFFLVGKPVDELINELPAEQPPAQASPRQNNT